MLTTFKIKHVEPLTISMETEAIKDLYVILSESSTKALLPFFKTIKEGEVYSVEHGDINTDDYEFILSAIIYSLYKKQPIKN